MPPTVVLVHGAFAESASWNGVIAHPLRGVADDAAAVSDLIPHADGSARAGAAV
jgi:hypothetical protein